MNKLKTIEIEKFFTEKFYVGEVIDSFFTKHPEYKVISIVENKSITVRRLNFIERLYYRFVKFIRKYI